MAQSQVNARLDREALEVLEAAAFAHQKSVGELIRPLIEAAAAQFAEQPAVKTALRARKEAAAATDGAAPPLPTIPKQGEG